MSKMTIRNDMTVELVQSMGDDRSVVAAARVSTVGEQSVSDFASDDVKSGLVNFLMKNRHGTPFEHNSMTFLIEAPIFVFREFHRHRVGWSYNEMSGRYKELEPVFYVPAADRPLVQVGKPGHYEFVPGTEPMHWATVQSLKQVYEIAYAGYQNMLSDGIAKEVARACLPVGIYSAMYATCNARSLMHFLSLRTKAEGSMFPSYPQREIEMVAEGMEKRFAASFPVIHRCFVENGRVAP